MVKLANTLDLGSSGAILAGSSPVTRTNNSRAPSCAWLLLIKGLEPARTKPRFKKCIILSETRKEDCDKKQKCLYIFYK